MGFPALQIVKEKENATHILRDYIIDGINTREGALRWVFGAAQKPELNPKTVEFDDFETYHDGTISTQINAKEIDGAAADGLAEKYKDSAIKCVSIIGEFAGKPFALNISLDSCAIGVSIRKSRMADCQELEKLLGLV